MLSTSISTLDKSKFIYLNLIKDTKQEEKRKPKPSHHTIFGDTDRHTKFKIRKQIQIERLPHSVIPSVTANILLSYKKKSLQTRLQGTQNQAGPADGAALPPGP